MNEIQFRKSVDMLWKNIQEYIDNLSDGNIDCDCHGDDVLNIDFNNDRKIVINRQATLRQIWLADKCDGYRFELKGNDWVCNRSGECFWNVLKRLLIHYQK